jgi:hypothetical protein
VTDCQHCRDNGVRCSEESCGAADPARDYTTDACRPCWVRLRARAAASGAPAPLPCVLLGAATPETAPCPPCGGRTRLKLHACGVHGRCSPHGPAAGVIDCPSCRAGGKGYEPDTYRLVAPVGTGHYHGRAARKPWEYRVTAALPHLGTPDELALAVDLLRLQAERPYLLVIDTGSPPAVRARLERMRAEDLEVHFVLGHGYVHSSAPVAAAMDLAFALCRTEHLFATHTDVFPLRRDMLSYLLGLCTPAVPVVGWEMSPRTSGAWKGAVSHTATAFHMPAMRRLGVTWSFERWYEANGVPPGPTQGWPDTESTLRRCLDVAGVKPLLLGPEANFARQTGVASYLGDPRGWFDHARSLPGLRAYAAGGELHRRAERYAAQAVADARARLSRWRAGGDP